MVDADMACPCNECVWQNCLVICTAHIRFCDACAYRHLGAANSCQRIIRCCCSCLSLINTFFEVLIISYRFHICSCTAQICVCYAYVSVQARTGPRGLGNRMFATIQQCYSCRTHSCSWHTANNLPRYMAGLKGQTGVVHQMGNRV